MKYLGLILALSLCAILGSCAKTLSDEDDFTLSDGGKSLDIYLSKGARLKAITENINIYSVENLRITGYLGGHNLAFLRTLTGGDDSDFITKYNLSSLDLEKCFFTSGDEVYYDRNGDRLTIGLSCIPQYAFENCNLLRSIILPDNLSPYNIETGAFANCILLDNIIWGSHVRKIGDEAFMKCSSISIQKPIVIPEGVSEIGDRAFKECIPLEVDLPSTIKSIGDEAFSPILKNVIIRATTPPSVEAASFIFYKNSDCILYVPEESLTDYSIEPYITIFHEIRPI